MYENDDELDDHYYTLGVYRSATKAEIEKAYRELVKKWHPDRNLDRHMAQKKLAEINKAYEILGNDRNRMEYDYELKEQERRDIEGNNRMPDTLFSDTESSMDMHKFKQHLRELNEKMEKQDPHWQKIDTDFNSSPENMCGPDDPILDTPYRKKLYDFMVGTVEKTVGIDTHFDLYLTLEDIHFAKTKKITINRKTTAFNYERHTFIFPIRRDIQNGQTFKMDQAGHYVNKFGILTREPGNCIVHVHILNHDYFTRIGIDLHVTYLISLKEAREGFERTLIDLDGIEHNIKIDKIERSDQIYLIRGAGMKKFESFRGNIVVNFAVKLLEAENKKKKVICTIDPNPMPKIKPEKKKVIQKNVVDVIKEKKKIRETKKKGNDE
jgi:DnaJ-class molecular chaperone